MVGGAISPQQQTPGARPDGGAAQAKTAAHQVTSGQAVTAAAVSVGIPDRKRAASHGESRRVDASFEKRGSKDSSSGSTKTGATGKAVDIKA